MKNWRRIVVGGILLVMLMGILTGCKTQEAEKRQITLKVKLPPLTVANADTGITDSYEVLNMAGEAFAAQYKDYDVTVEVVKFGYTEEDEYITGCFDTDDAADILLEGYFNMAGYIHTGRVVPLDDMITEEMRADVDDALWKMSQVDGKTYMLPYYSLQNTLIYNKDLFRQCGLAEYIGVDGVIQSWTPEEWEHILSTLAANLPDMTYPMLMYAKNDQGDTHIMTLLRSKGSHFFDENGRFNLNTEEGIAALQWIADSYQKSYYHKSDFCYIFQPAVRIWRLLTAAICLSITSLPYTWQTAPRCPVWTGTRQELPISPVRMGRDIIRRLSPVSRFLTMATRRRSRLPRIFCVISCLMRNS